MRKLYNTLLALACFSAASAQDIHTHRNCSSWEVLQSQMAADPAMIETRRQIEEYTEQYAIEHEHDGARAIITIPVVFHVVYNTTTENVSDACIDSQLALMNRDFHKLNSDWTSTPSAWTSLVADVEIQFCKAQRDPSGAATTGVTRTSTSVTSFGTSDLMKYNSSGGHDIWDRDDYLNIWICDLSSGLLGYAQFPGGTAATDGVVIDYEAFGNIAPAAAPFNKGRTATHEVGHWLNLYHIWGDDGTACTGSDLVGDTPNQADENYGCYTAGTVLTDACSPSSPGVMWMNYMDYTDDACMYMFTEGQKTRMRALFDVGGARNSLTTSLGCTAPTGGSSCGVPTGLGTSAIGATTATVTWNAVSGATLYHVRYRKTTATTWTVKNATMNSKALTGLTASKDYEFQVEAVCGTELSGYSASAYFSTTCADAYEMNNTSGTATVVYSGTTYKALINSTTDVDWFKLKTTSTKKNVKFELTSPPADYDLELWNSTATTMYDISDNGGTSNETVIYNGGAANTYYKAKAYGYAGAYNTSTCYSIKGTISSTAFRLDGSPNPDEETIEEDVLVEGAFSIYPNPVQDELTVLYSGYKEGTIEIVVYDMMGNVITRSMNQFYSGENAYYLDVKNLIAGTYVIQINDGSDEVKTSRFIKN